MTVAPLGQRLVLRKCEIKCVKMKVILQIKCCILQMKPSFAGGSSKPKVLVNRLNYDRRGFQSDLLDPGLVPHHSVICFLRLECGFTDVLPPSSRFNVFCISNISLTKLMRRLREVCDVSALKVVLMGKRKVTFPGALLRV